MGKIESKTRKINEKTITLSSKIKKDFNCPLCNKKFTGSMTYLQLNQHLFRCGNIRAKPGTSLNLKLKKNFSFSNISESNRENKRYNGSTIFKDQKIDKNKNLKLFMNSNKKYNDCKSLRIYNNINFNEYNNKKNNII